MSFFKKTLARIKHPYLALGFGVLAMAFAIALSSRTALQLDFGNIAPVPEPSPTPRRIEPVPETVRAIYLTGYSAGNQEKINEVIGLAEATELNGVVIDIKDYTGKVFFKTDAPLVQEIGAEELRIPDFAALIERLHAHGIYVSARIAVFQDVHLAKEKPALAIKNIHTGAPWKDRKGLTWVDPASQEVWDYNLAVARAAIAQGVDEVNFDYVRFPSDGDMQALSYPVYHPAALSKAKQMQQFFAYVHDALKDLPAQTSVDLFGLVTVNEDDLGIGQVLEYALPYFDYVCPMVYPSHYAKGFLNYQNPAQYPYEVVDYSLEKAQARIRALDAALHPTPLPSASGAPAASSSPAIRHIDTALLPSEALLGKLRPWLQVFDLGASYTPEMVRKQIQATYDNGVSTGWYLWNPSNLYSRPIFLAQ